MKLPLKKKSIMEKEKILVPPPPPPHTHTHTHTCSLLKTFFHNFNVQSDVVPSVKQIKARYLDLIEGTSVVMAGSSWNLSSNPTMPDLKR